MRLQLGVSVSFFVFIVCSTALSSSAFLSPSNIIPSTATKDSTKTVTTSASIPSVTSYEPCLLASRAIASFSSLRPSAPLQTIPAEIAYNCLKSVPIVKHDALRLVTDLAPYFELQSTIGILKKPPSGYLLPGVYLVGGLERIKSNIENGIYTSEYDFGLDLHTLVLSAHDGHFNFGPDIFSGVFLFRRNQSLASVSRDGLELPKIYLQQDLLRSENGSFIPSPVISIDGKDAVSFLQDWSFGTFEAQDPDAAYNGMFSSPAAQSAEFTPRFFASSLYPGAATTFTFENGTTRSFPNVAVALIKLKGIKSGKDLYNKVVKAEASATLSSSSAPRSSATPLPTGYPRPVVKHSSNLISGFFLQDSVYNDIAVLSVSAFLRKGSIAEVQEFQRVLQEFLVKAKRSKKTKLIIDLQANGGGFVSLGVELFAQLFPSLPPYSGRNMRANKANAVLGEMISGLNATSQVHEVDLEYNFTANPVVRLVSTPYNYREDVLPDGSATYGSWSQVFGPTVTSHDNFTNVFRSNFSDPLWINDARLIATGTRDRVGVAQPFAAKDIVIISDGNCASTCATFSEYMKTQVGVPTIAVGGRPQYGPMQGVGGVKGAEVDTLAAFFNGVELAYSQAPPNLLERLNDTVLGEFSHYPTLRATTARFNFLNNIRRGDTSATPLQFVYEAADCRFFYTAEMLANISTVWTRVAHMAFGNSSSPQQNWTRNPRCVRGSTGHRSAVSVGGSNNTDYAGSAPPAGAKGRAQLPLLSDGTRMGWRLKLNGSSTNETGRYRGATISPVPYSSSAPRVANDSHATKVLAAALSLILGFMLS
ncbi:hypothetical protein MMC07_000220 [Pseudocyphellaria aurata]|nr:hypothetical protein [Pseudocyphellaria aurata]